MKVKKCIGCPKCKRKTWTSYFKPKNYHAIGIKHAYAYCDYHKKRVSYVTKCELKDGEQG